MFIEQEESSAATTAALPSVTLTSGTSDVSQYPVLSLPIEGCVYRGEGNANLVVALPSERAVIRLRKSATAGGGSSSPLEEEDEKDARRVRREVDFIRAVISGFLGCYVCVPEILRCDAAEIARLSEKIRPARPENRRNKDVVGVYATKFPDYTFLSENLSGFSSKPTFCVEIKPKQGFLCKTDRQFPKCPYCLTQFYKTRNGSTSKPSSYCPFDLFSGEATRINSAVEALLRSPQNNLKIFKDGEIVYDEKLCSEETLQRVLASWMPKESSSLEGFLELVRCALTRPFDAAERQLPERPEPAAEDIAPPPRLQPERVERVKTLLRSANEECELLSGEGPPVGSVLERILRMQRVHRCGADAVAWIHANFATILTDELIYADLLDAAPEDSLQREIDNDDEVELPRKRQLLDSMVQSRTSDLKFNSISCRSGKCEVSNQEEWPISNKVIKDNLLKNITTQDCLNILRNYLLFCTAKDCSILMAFQEVDKKLPTNINSTHRIDLSKDQTFLVSVRVLDLDAKSLRCINKHRQRDNDVLEATIAELEKKFTK